MTFADRRIPGDRHDAIVPRRTDAVRANESFRRHCTRPGQPAPGDCIRGRALVRSLRSRRFLLGERRGAASHRRLLRAPPAPSRSARERWRTLPGPGPYRHSVVSGKATALPLASDVGGRADLRSSAPPARWSGLRGRWHSAAAGPTRSSARARCGLCSHRRCARDDSRASRVRRGFRSGAPRVEPRLCAVESGFSPGAVRRTVELAAIAPSVGVAQTEAGGSSACEGDQWDRAGLSLGWRRGSG